MSLFGKNKGAKNPLDSVGQQGTVRWGKHHLPLSQTTQHFLVAGATGSGKTSLINLLLSTVLPRIVQGTDARAIIYDAKTEAMSFLTQLGIDVTLDRGAVKILHPFDARCFAWDIARDIKRAEEIQEVATLLFPKEDTINPFFDNAAADLLAGVITSFVRNPKTRDNWTLRDVLLTLDSPHYTRQVLLWEPNLNAGRARDYVGDEVDPRTAANIRASIRTKIADYRVIASYWHQAVKANRKVSFEHWLANEYILMLGSSHKSPRAMEAMNRVMFRRLTQLMLDQANSESRRTWVVLDEVGTAGKLEGLSELLVKGRSKGACAVIGFQDISSLREHYGDNIAAEIVGQVANKAFLRLESDVTAEWASKTFGDKDEKWDSPSVQANLGGNDLSFSRGKSKQRLIRPIYLPSEFMRQARDRDCGGLPGIYNTYGHEPDKDYVLPFSELVPKPLSPRENIDFQPWDVEYGFLEPWSRAELEKLLLVPIPQVDPEKEIDSLFEMAQGLDVDNRTNSRREG